MSTPQQASQPDVITQMVQDPDFAKLPLDQQRLALTAHDPTFANAGDDALTQFVQAHQSVAPQAPQQPPGFFKRLGQSVGIPTSPEEVAAQQQSVKDLLPTNAKDIAESFTPTGFIKRLVVDPYLKTAGQGFKEGYQQADEADQQLKAGEISTKQAVGKTADAAVHSVVNAIPFVGPAINTAGADVAAGNYRGAAGGLTGVLGQVVVPEAIERGRGAASSLRAAAADALDSSAKTDLGKVLAPTKQATKFISRNKVIPEMQDRGIVASSSKSLQDRAASNMETSGQAIDNAYDAMPQQPSIPTHPIIDDLEAYKKNFVNDVPAYGETPAKQVVLDQGAIDRIQTLQDTIAAHGDALDPQTLRTLRNYFDENVARAKGYQGKTLAEGQDVDVQRQAANSIRSQLAQAVPGLSDLNSEFTFWKNLHDVLDETAQRRTGQLGGGLTRKIAAGTGAMVGAGATHYFGGGPMADVMGAAIGGKTAETLSRITNSTAWNTVKAAAKTKLANALAARDPAAINSAVSQIAQTLPKSVNSGPVPVPAAVPSGPGTVPAMEQPLAAGPSFLRAPEATAAAQEAAPRGPSFLRQPEAAPTAPEQPTVAPERRVDMATRQRVQDMGPEDRATALLTSEKTGLPNYRAFQESGPEQGQNVGYADLDNFKQFNTALGHQEVDTAVLPAIGKMFQDAAKKEGVNVFHRSGDEFLMRSDDPAAISRVTQAVNEKLANTTFEYERPDGTIVRQKGTGLSHGIGADEQAAELSSQTDKANRAAQGLRTERPVQALDTSGATGQSAQVGNNPGRSGVQASASNADQADSVSQGAAPIYDQNYRGPLNIAAVKAVKDNPQLPASVRRTAQGVYEAVVDSGMSVINAMRLNGTDELAKQLGGRFDKTINAQPSRSVTDILANRKKGGK